MAGVLALTAAGRQRVDELLGVPDVEGRDGHQAARLPHLHLVGEADEVEAVVGAQVLQDGEQGVLGLSGRGHSVTVMIGDEEEGRGGGASGRTGRRGVRKMDKGTRVTTKVKTQLYLL